MMSNSAQGTIQTTTQRGFFHFFGGKHIAIAPTLETVFGAISGRSSDRTRSSEDRLLQRAANDDAQR